jgi:hypothetical protein
VVVALACRGGRAGVGMQVAKLRGAAHTRSRARPSGSQDTCSARCRCHRRGRQHQVPAGSESWQSPSIRTTPAPPAATDIPHPYAFPCPSCGHRHSPLPPPTAEGAGLTDDVPDHRPGCRCARECQARRQPCCRLREARELPLVEDGREVGQDLLQQHLALGALFEYDGEGVWEGACVCVSAGISEGSSAGAAEGPSASAAGAGSRRCLGH